MAETQATTSKRALTFVSGELGSGAAGIAAGIAVVAALVIIARRSVMFEPPGDFIGWVAVLALLACMRVLPIRGRWIIEVDPVSNPFCSDCDRARLTTDGTWLLCLYAARGLDLRALIRGGAGREALAEAIAGAWRRRRDRGAEERKALEDRGEERGILVPVEDLRRDPRREMHVRGG